MKKKHIRSKSSSYTPGEVYSVVYTENWNQPLEDHPSVLEHPEVFEIVDDYIPETFEYLIYTS